MRGTTGYERSGSSLESFLDDYQSFRLVVGGIGLLYILVMVAGGWWQWGSPLPSLLGSAGLAGHATWCRIRGIRAPRTMLMIDTTLVGASLFSLPTPVMASFFGLLAMVVGLFTERWWRMGLLAYLTGWYAIAFVVGSGTDANSVRALLGTFFAVAAGVTLMVKLRTWMGRLDANRSQMLGTVSHELRNNLTGVLGLTEVVTSTDDLDPAEATELLGMVNQQAEDASEIVEDLLTASRIERAVLTTSPELVDVNKEATTTARRFQGSGTDITLRLDDNLPSVSGDALRIRQILRNLVSNATRR
jgi:signal transduction histidine kinase